MMESLWLRAELLGLARRSRSLRIVRLAGFVPGVALAATGAPTAIFMPRG